MKLFSNIKNSFLLLLILSATCIGSDRIEQSYRAENYNAQRDFIAFFSLLMKLYQSVGVDCDDIVQHLLDTKDYLNVSVNRTMHQATLAEKQQAFALDVMRLLMYIQAQGYACTFGETVRSVEQAAMYAQQGIGIKNSLHCKRLAIDINLFDSSGNYLRDSREHGLFGAYWKSLHAKNRWGGDFQRRDGNHYERQE